MTPLELEQFEKLSRQAELEQAKRLQAETQISQMSNFQAGKEPNIIEYQLDVSPILDRIFHLLSGHIAVQDPVTKRESWVEPTDDRLKIYSEYGVKEIMTMLSHYISPATLLGDITDEEQYRIAKEFGIDIADLIYNRYEHFYYYPSPEELFASYKKLVKNLGLNITDQELYKKCCEWSDQELQSKFRHYGMTVNSLTHQVFMALSRAKNGEERDSLRKQYNIHQTLNGGNVPVAPQKSLFNKGIWGK